MPTRCVIKLRRNPLTWFSNGYAVADDGYGTGPIFLKTTHHGWRDQWVGAAIGGGVAPISYGVFDGHRYRGVWSAMISSEQWQTPSVMHMSEFPPEILHDILRRHGHADAKFIKVIADNGWCYRGDVDGDGRDECVLWVNAVEVDGGRLTLGDHHEPNLYVYTRNADGWAMLVQAYHTGDITLPRRDKHDPDRFIIGADIQGRAGTGPVKSAYYTFARTGVVSVSRPQH